MTKEEVLQKVNDYCNEKSYTTATLTDAFRDKFADHFQREHAEGDINDEAILSSMKFSINTAFKSASDIATIKANEFTSKENEYKAQIEELQKKITPNPQPTPPPAVSPEVQQQLDELKKFKEGQQKQEKLQRILEIAKEGIRDDLHASFDTFVSDYDVDLNKEDKVQAESLVKKFQDIFKDSVGSIKPKAPVQTAKQDAEFIESLPKVEVS